MIEQIHSDINNINKILTQNKVELKNIKENNMELISKYITDNELHKLVVQHEFDNVKVDHQLSTIDEIIDLFKIVLHKYQGVIGGYNIEDPCWIVNIFPDKSRFKLKENMAVIYNTLSVDNINDKETFVFCEKILEHIKKFTKNNIKLKIIKDNNNDIIWIVYIIMDKLSQ